MEQSALTRRSGIALHGWNVIPVIGDASIIPS